MYTAAMVWFVLMVAFIIAEAACPFHLISVWFAAGALVATVVSLLGGPVWLQTVVFLVVSGTLLIALWPFVKKFLNPKLTKTNVDALVGSRGYVTAAIDNLAATGQVKLGAMEWTARSTSGDPIAVGTLVTVDRIEGVKAFVSEVEIREKVTK
jgi:membrane protein implicated in regulation of membrane protease activity